MYVSRCVRNVTKPFRLPTAITVFEDGWVPLAHVATALNIGQQTLESALNGEAEFKRYARDKSPYRSHAGNTPIANMVSRKGLQRIFSEYICWPSFRVEQAMKQIYDKNNKYEAVESAAPKKVTFREEEEVVIPLPHARDPLSERLDAFLVKMDQRIGEQALWRAQQTPEFRQRVEASVQEKADALFKQMEGEVRRGLEAEMRRKLEPEIRKEIKKRIRSEVQAEVEPFRQKLLNEETQKVFSEQQPVPEIDASALVNDILKRRKLEVE